MRIAASRGRRWRDWIILVETSLIGEARVRHPQRPVLTLARPRNAAFDAQHTHSNSITVVMADPALQETGTSSPKRAGFGPIRFRHLPGSAMTISPHKED